MGQTPSVPSSSSFVPHPVVVYENEKLPPQFGADVEYGTIPSSRDEEPTTTEAKHKPWTPSSQYWFYEYTQAGADAGNAPLVGTTRRSASNGSRYSNIRTDQWERRETRLEFIRRVYHILTLQLIVTGVICAIMSLHKPTQMYVMTHGWVLVLSMIMSFVVLALLFCYRVSEAISSSFLLLMLGVQWLSFPQ